MSSREPKKLYEKPSVTRIRLQIEHSVLQGCNTDLPNRTGYGYEECWFPNEWCLKNPA
jgi:hypothetical protein